MAQIMTLFLTSFNDSSKVLVDLVSFAANSIVYLEVATTMWLLYGILHLHFVVVAADVQSSVSPRLLAIGPSQILPNVFKSLTPLYSIGYPPMLLHYWFRLDNSKHPNQDFDAYFFGYVMAVYPTVVGVAQDVTEGRKHAQALREMQYVS
jgi:hypothetical protein